MSIAPDELIDYLVENIAFNGDEGASIEELWKYTEEKIATLSDFLKETIWKWLTDEKTKIVVGIANENQLQPEEVELGPAALTVKYGDKLRLYATEAYQWLILTGKPKEGNGVGAFPFELLCSISRSRFRGMTSVELAKETQQDPRSIRGRILLLMDLGLVKRFPMVAGGMTTNLVVFKKFVNGNRLNSSAKAEPGIDMNKLRMDIVSKVKEGKNQLRDFQDLKVQLGFDKGGRYFAIFGATVRSLESQGYVKRVIVHTKDLLTSRIYKVRCIKFLKDLSEDMKGDSDLSDDSDFAEVDEEGEGNNEREGGQENVNNNKSAGRSELGPDIETSTLVKIDDDTPEQADGKPILFNQFYPLENQIYDMINNGGAFGLPAMDLYKNIVGVHYVRCFARVLETICEKQSNSKQVEKKKLIPPKNLEYLTIIRGLDFSARMQFYRYFSQPGYCNYAGKPCEEILGNWKVIDLSGCQKTLQDAEKKCFSLLPGLVEVFADKDGRLFPLFHGKKGAIDVEKRVIVSSPTPASISGKKRGRPRKRIHDSDETAEENRSKEKKMAKVEATPKTKTDKVRKQRVKKVVGGSEGQDGDSNGVGGSLDRADAGKEKVEVIPNLTKTGKVRKQRVKKVSSKAVEEEEGGDISMTVSASEELIERTDRGMVSGTSTPTPTPTPIPIELTPTPQQISSLVKSEPPEDHPSTPTNIPIEPTIKIEIDDSVSPKPSMYSTPLETTPTIPSTPSITPDLLPIIHEGPSTVTPLIITPNRSDATTPSNANIAVPSPRTSRLSTRSKQKQKSEISFAFIKRKSQVLSIIKEHNGVIEGGTTLQSLIIDKFSATDGSSIDRKTVKKVTNQMVASGELNQIFVTVPRDIHITKELLLLPTVDIDGEVVKDAKMAIIEKVKKKPSGVKATVLSVETKDFQYYAIRDKRTRRLAEIDSKNKAKTAAKEAKAKAKAKAKAEAKSKLIKDSPSSSKKPMPKKPRLSKKIARSEGDYSTAPIMSVSASMDSNTVPLVMVPIPPPTFPPPTAIPSAIPSHVTKTRPSSLERIYDSGTSSVTNSGFKRKLSSRSTKLDADRFYRVVVIVRSLISTGLGLIDWNQVVTAFPSLSVDHAKTKWPRIRDMHGGGAQIPRAMKRWEKLFIKSYESGELPLIENEQYDVGFYADFWKAKEGELGLSNVPWLFDNVDDMTKEYDIVDIDHNDDPLEYIFTSVSMVKTEEVMTATPFGVNKCEAPIISDLDKVKQSIKGTILTSHSIYNANLSRDILLQHGADNITKSIEEMERDKVIIYLPRDKEKVMPGRNYFVSDKYNASLHLRIGNEVFNDATQFENKLISTFQSSKGMIMSRIAPDSSLISIIDLVCYRKIDLVRFNTVTELLKSGYRSRIIDKDKCDSDIIFRAGDEKLQELQRPKVALPLGDKPCEYSWTSIQATINKDIWLKIIKQVLIIISFRPGITSISLHNRLAVVLTYEECLKVLEWLYGIECISKGEYDSYYIQPRWYANIFG